MKPPTRLRRDTTLRPRAPPHRCRSAAAPPSAVPRRSGSWGGRRRRATGPSQPNRSPRRPARRRRPPGAPHRRGCAPAYTAGSVKPPRRPRQRAGESSPFFSSASRCGPRPAARWSSPWRARRCVARRRRRPGATLCCLQRLGPNFLGRRGKPHTLGEPPRRPPTAAVQPRSVAGLV